MRHFKILAALFLLSPLGACLPARTSIKGQRPAAQTRPAPPSQLSPANRVLVEQLYYQAVSAYSADDIKAAELYLSEIFKLAPSYAPAKELKEKIRLATGRR